MKISLERRVAVSFFALTLAGSLTIGVSASVLAAPVAFSDAFDRPDSPDVGNGWLEVSEGLSISGMELRGAPTRSGVFQMAILPTFSGAAQTVAASFARPNNSSPRFGLVLRYQGPQDYYLVSRTSGGSSLVQISRVVNGVETVLATKALPNPVLNTFFRLEGQADEATLTLRVDGVQMLSVADSTFSAGNVGIGLGSLSNTTGQILRADNFAASGSDGATAPVITRHPSSVTVAVGQPASFSVSAEGTQPLSFQWQRDNVDIAGETAATYTLPSAALSDSGASFQAVVTNSIDTVTSNSATLTVVTSTVPTGNITAPAEGSTYSAGDTIDYEGTGTDPEDGTLPASAFTWRVDFHHDTHFHEFLSNTSGMSGSFTIPTVDETSSNVWYRIHLTVRDSTGLTSSSFRDVLPNTVDLAFETNPPGLQVKVDGLALATPAEITSVVGLTRTIGVVSPQTLNNQSYVFGSWVHGGTATQDVQTPTVDTTYIATYVPSGGGTFTDGFDRPDSPDVGNGWLEVSGDLSISGMVLRSAPIRQLLQMAIVPSLSSARQTVAASFVTQTNNNSPRFGVVLRYQNTQNYYLVSRRTGGTNAVQISKVVNGIETVLATTSPPNIVMNTFFRLEGQANEATLTLALDGVPMLSVADSTFAAGNVGIGLDSLSNPSGQSHRADNFAASGSGGATGPTLALGATPTNVALSGTSTLSWSTTGADACSFTSGLSGARPVTGSESTGALTSTTSFAMTCTGSGGSVAKSVTVTVGDAPPTPLLPTAAEVYASQAMVLPPSVRAFVILVPNEAHDPMVSHRITPNDNGHMLPTKVTLPAGASVSVLNADHGHEHKLNVWNGTMPIFTTGKLVYGALSAPARLDPGTYTLIDWQIPFIRGEITVGEVQSEGTLLVGAFFMRTNLLPYYRNAFPANGFRIESEYAFINSSNVQERDHVLIIFSTDEDISVAGPKLQVLVKANSYD